jgi:hypothetical protein
MSTEPAPALNLSALSRKTIPSAAHLHSWPNTWFYFGCAWLIGAIVAYGFAHTLSGRLLNAAIPRPRILWIHAAAFFAWIGLFILQSTLVRSRRVRWHRRLGVAIVLLGATMPLIGIATSLEMARFNVAHGLRDPDYAAAFLSIPFNDMVFFTSVLAAAVWWRKRTDIHRRLMLVATCLLTAAAFPRFPFITIQALRWYAGVDTLLLLGVLHDLIVRGRVHPAYAISLPPVLVGQFVAMTLFLARPHWWVEVGRYLIG